MSPPASRPAPLRVQVLDIAARASLVTPLPPASESVPPGAAVLQRPVRIISDPPPGFAQPPGGAGHVAPGSLSAGGGVRPPAEAEGLRREANGDHGGASASRRAAEEQSLPVTLPADAEDDFDDDEPTTVELGSDLLEAEGLDADEPVSVVESLDNLELSEALDGDDDGPVDNIEVSVPPPAPPEAIARSGSGHPERGAAERPEIEEIDLESSGSMDDDEDDEIDIPLTDSAAPPPPPVSDPPPLLPGFDGRIPEPRPSRPRAQAWWEVFFDDDYLRTVRPPTPEQIIRQCDFIESRLGLKAGAAVLDVGCGLGMQILELASRGYVGVGLDLSLPMLSRAAEEAQSRNLKLNFLHSDMREMSFDASFDAVICIGTTLGYFDDETNRKILERLYRALKPGGVLLLEVVNRDHVISAQPNLIWFEGDGCVCMEESEFNFFASRLHVKRTVILDNGRQTETEYGLRLYSLHELGQILNGAGFRVSEVSGREAIPGVFFGHESPNILIVAERRVAPEAASGAVE